MPWTAQHLLFRLNIFFVHTNFSLCLFLFWVGSIASLSCTILQSTVKLWKSQQTRSQTVEATKSDFWHTVEFFFVAFEITINCDTTVLEPLTLFHCLYLHTHKNENKTNRLFLLCFLFFLGFVNLARICSIRYLVNGLLWMRKKNTSLIN